MAKKIKKKAMPAPTNDPRLEAVGEDRAFEIEFDEETNEVVFVHHYRQQWGDGFDADVEHGLNLQENNDLICTLLQLLERQKNKAASLLPHVPTPAIEEGNPAQGPKMQN